MPVVIANVHSGNIHGTDHFAAGIIVAQTAIGGVPINRSIDRQSLAAQIITLQKRLVVLGKMTANQVNQSIGDQYLAQKLTQVETLANT